MRIPTQLSRGLNESELESLESQLKGTLAKQLRKVIKDQIEATYQLEESLPADSLELGYLKMIGERRGFRSVLALLPEE